MRISRHAAHAEKNQGFETADILLRIPELLHVVIIGSARRTRAHSRAVRARASPFPLCTRSISSRMVFSLKFTLVTVVNNPSIISSPRVRVHIRRVVRRPCKTDERAGQLVLKLSNVVRFAANARFSSAAACNPLSAHTENKTSDSPFEILAFTSVKYSSVRGNGHDLPRDELSRSAATRFSPRAPVRRSREPPCERPSRS